MNILQAVCSSRGVQTARTLIVVSIGAALVSGFFVPLKANAVEVPPVPANLTDPNGGEFWRGTINIEWVQTGGSADDQIQLLFSTDNFSTTAQSIVSAVDLGDETYPWNTTSVANGSTYKVRISPAGNSAIYDTSLANFMIDNAAPTTEQSLSVPAVDGWYNISTGVPTIELSCDDGAGSGCNKSYFSWGGGAVVTYSGAFSPAEGIHTLSYWSDDNATDQAGARNVESNDPVIYQVDITRPELVSANVDDTALNIGDTATVTFTFSEAVSGFTADDATVPNGSITVPFSSDGGVIWTATLTPNSDVEAGSNEITVNQAGVIDVAGNAGTGTAESNSYDVDTIRPTLVITMDDAALNIGDTAMVTFTFSEEPASFDSSDVSIENGSLGSITPESETVFTVVFTPTEGVEDAMNVIAVGTDWTDVAGNAPSGGSSTPNYEVDTIAPTATIAYSDADALVKLGDSLTITATFSQPLLDSPVVNIALSGSNTLAATEMTKVDSTHYTYTHTVGAGDGLSTIALSVGTDAAGNEVVSEPTTGASFMVDNTPPTLGITLSDDALKIGDTSTVTFTWSEPVTDFDNTDITVINNGSLSAVSSTDGEVFSAIFTPSAAVEDAENIITVDKTGVLDIASNAGVDSQDSPNYAIDTIAPTVSSITTKDANADGIVDTAAIVFSEAMKDSTFTATAFTIGGTAGTGFSSGSEDDDATVDITHGGVAGTDVKDVLYTPGGVTDLAGNPLSAVLAGDEAEIDAAGPVMLSARTTTTSTIVATFSEDLDGATVTTADFTVPTYGDATVSETAPGIVTITTTIPFGTGATPSVTSDVGIKDLPSAGHNPAPQAYTVTTVDGVAPVVTAVHIQSNNANTSLAKVGDVVTLTFTSSEEIATPVVTIGAGSAVVEEVELNEWTATRTMTPDDVDGIVAFSIAFEDVVEPANIGETVEEVTDDSSVLFDKNAPDVDAGPLNEVNEDVFQGSNISDEEPDAGSGIATWEWSFEQIAGAAGGEVTFSPSFEGTSDDSDVMISADTDGVYELTLTVTDNAGNVGSDTTTLIWDTMAPRLHYTFPNSGSTGVPTDADEMNAFFRELNHGEYDENIVLLDENRVFLEDTAGGAVQDDIAVDDGNGESNRLNIAYNELDNGTTYCLTILAGAVRDVAGNETTQDITGPCFTTEEDTEPPFITLLMATDIEATEATIEAQTDEPALCRIGDIDQQFSDMNPFDGSDDDGLVHTVVLGELEPESLYNFYVRCQDEQENVMTNSGHVQFATDNDDTSAPPAPVITTADEITVNSDTFVITGTLGEGTPADAHTITVYNGLAIAGTISLVSGQSAWGVVVPLPQNATSTFTATATDEAGNVSGASNAVDIGESDAIGAPDTTAPDAPVITTDAPDGTVDADTFTLSGTAADDGGTRIVTIYRNSAPVAVGSTVLATGETSWSASVPLTQNTGNTFNARSIDEVGNESGASDSVTITEASADSAAPAITDTAITDVTSGTATLTVTTDGEAACKVGPEDVAYGSLPYSLTAVSPTSYTYAFAELNDSTTYDFYVRCQDTSGNASDSAHVTFTTLSNDDTAPTISDIQTTSIGLDTVTVEWITDEPSTSRVEYGTSSAYGESTATTDTGEEEDSEMTTEHSVTIGGLDSSTTYHFRVHSIDGEENEGTSGDNTFATDADDTTAGLHVDGVTNVRTAAIANDEWADGWAWTFRITVPSNETDFWMSFTDFAGTDAENIIPAGGNVRYYSAQSINADTSEDAIVISEANEYPENALMVDTGEDLDAATLGIQVEVRVEVKVPEGTESDTYSASYRIKTEGLDEEV